MTHGSRVLLQLSLRRETLETCISCAQRQGTAIELAKHQDQGGESSRALSPMYPLVATALGTGTLLQNAPLFSSKRCIAFKLVLLASRFDCAVCSLSRALRDPNHVLQALFTGNAVCRPSTAELLRGRGSDVESRYVPAVGQPFACARGADVPYGLAGDVCAYHNVCGFDQAAGMTTCSPELVTPCPSGSTCSLQRGTNGRRCLSTAGGTCVDDSQCEYLASK